jgi:hypothetical protein
MDGKDLPWQFSVPLDGAYFVFLFNSVKVLVIFAQLPAVH